MSTTLGPQTNQNQTGSNTKQALPDLKYLLKEIDDEEEAEELEPGEGNESWRPRKGDAQLRPTLKD